MKIASNCQARASTERPEADRPQAHVEFFHAVSCPRSPTLVLLRLSNVRVLSHEVPSLRGIYYLNARPTLARMIVMHLDPAPSCKRRGWEVLARQVSSSRGPIA